MLSGLGNILELILFVHEFFCAFFRAILFYLGYITNYSKTYWFTTVNIKVSVDQESRCDLPGPSASVSITVIRLV